MPFQSREIVVTADGDLHCGVRRYADEISLALRALGYKTSVQSVFKSFDCRALKADTILNFELIDGISHPVRFIALCVLLYLRKVFKSSNVLLVHSVFSLEVLKLKTPNIIADAVIFVQKTILHMLSHASQIVVQTAAGQKELEKLGVSSVLIEHGTFMKGASSCPERSLRSQWGFEETDILIGLVGHPYKFKRYAEFAEMFAKYICLLYDKVHLVYIGGDPDRDRAEWNRITLSLASNPKGRTFITGPLSDDQFDLSVRSLDVAALPYEPRAQASGVLASLVACGIPCLVSDSPLFEAVLNAQAALSISGKPEQDAVQVIEFITSKQYLIAAANARDFAKTHSMQQTVRELLTAIDTFRAKV